MKKFTIAITIFSIITTLISCNKLKSNDNSKNNSNSNQENTHIDNQKITQFGITWVLDNDKKYTTGQFANGDYWVVGPVRIIHIDPVSKKYKEQWTGSPAGPNLGEITRTMHGAMINPIPDQLGDTHGYDSHMNVFPNEYDSYYDDSLNAARPNGDEISESNPLIIQPGSSLISVISNTINELQDLGSNGGKSNLKSASILTVLAQAPPEGSFRPPYVGTDKTIRYNKSDLDYTLLQNLTHVEHTPDLADIERYFERPWLDHIIDWLNTYMHPSESMHFYGANIAREIGDGVLMLNLNLPKEQKEKLYIRLVQVGIDFAAFCDNGGYYPPRGAINLGRKLPILLAGYALNDSHMKNVGNWSINVSDSGGTLTSIFQEDSQLFSVEETSPGIFNYGYGNYDASHVGMPEWSRRHEVNPEYHANVDFDYDGYRVINGRAWISHALALHIMGLTAAWGNDVFLAYEDRFWSIDYNPDPDDGSYSHRYGAATNFARNMWEIYRSDYTMFWP